MNTLCGRVNLSHGAYPGNRCAVGIEGPKWTRMVMVVDGGFLKIVRIRGKVDPVPLDKYTPVKLARRFKKFGRKQCSKSAWKLLQRIIDE